MNSQKSRAICLLQSLLRYSTKPNGMEKNSAFGRPPHEFWNLNSLQAVDGKGRAQISAGPA
jgi:hypothetical protein